MKLRIVPYKLGSKSAKLLAEKLSAVAGYKVFRGLLPKSSRLNLHWGSTLGPDVFQHINHPTAIAKARNKYETFTALSGVCSIPLFTTDKETAKGWVDQGKTVLARTTTGQGGSGITIVDSGGDLPDAPLYVVYVKKLKEYRVHVINGEVVAVHEKRKKRGVESDPRIRSHSRGWVFCKLDVWEPDGLREEALKAVDALGLNFGAVDIIWNSRQNKCFVLEVNTAPGLCNQTGDLYATHLAAN